MRELEARLAKDSHNSGKPPSSDGLGRKTKSLRRTSGKKPGGQLGHCGETLRLVHLPDDVVEHRPARCVRCQAPLEGAPVVERERRQVHDLPTLRLVIREHQALHVACPHCQTVTIGMFPAEASSRAQYGPRLRALSVYLVQQQLVPYGRVRELLADVFGAHLSLGTLVTWVQQAAAALVPVEAAIVAALQRAPVLHSDETGVRQAGHLAWAHVACTSRLTHYAIHAKRGAEATEAIGILPQYRGVSVHDGWKPYWAHTACRHALCNIHHLRELTFLEEQYAQAWAKDLKGLLREMKAATDRARAAGAVRLPQEEYTGLRARYEHLLATRLAANPPPVRPLHRRGRLKQSPARNLLERPWLGRAEVLAFLDDLAIPFDNNRAERDLRMLKVQQKVSGCFRSERGATAFARVRGYLSSLSKHGTTQLAALEAVFTGHPSTRAVPRRRRVCMGRRRMPFELLAGALPAHMIARHPTGAYLAMETAQTPPAVGIWEATTGQLVWAEAGTCTVEWTHSGTQLLVVWEEQSVSVQRPGAPTLGDERDQRDEREPRYVVDRWNWPAGQRESTCALHLPYSAWPVNLWIASTDTLVAVRWMDQGASGWEPVVIRPAGGLQVRGAGFELASEVGVETYPALSPDGRFAVSGYQPVYRSTPHGQQAPQHRGRFEVGRIVVIIISAATYRDILVDDAVPAQRHGTVYHYKQNFAVTLTRPHDMGVHNVFDVLYEPTICTL